MFAEHLICSTPSWQSWQWHAFKAIASSYIQGSLAPVWRSGQSPYSHPLRQRQWQTHFPPQAHHPADCLISNQHSICSKEHEQVLCSQHNMKQISLRHFHLSQEVCMGMQGPEAHNHVAFLLAMADQASLPADLGCNVIVWQPGCREERDLLASGDGVHCVDGWDACLNHFLRVCALGRVDGGTVNVEERLGQDSWPAKGLKITLLPVCSAISAEHLQECFDLSDQAGTDSVIRAQGLPSVNRLARAVEDSTQLITGHRSFQHLQTIYVTF